MSDTQTLDQRATQLNLGWSYGDTIFLQFDIELDWSGVYRPAQIKEAQLLELQPLLELDVDAVWDGTKTTFTLTAADSTAVPEGTQAWSLKTEDGQTRLVGRVFVGPAVTA